MKKSAKIYIVVFVWLSALIQFFVNENVEAGQQVAEAFNRTEIMHYDSQLTIEGIYGNNIYSDEKICNILGNLMEEMLPSQKACIYKGSNRDIWYAVSGNDDIDILISFVKDYDGKDSLLKTELYIKNTESNTADNDRQPIDIWQDELCTMYERLGMNPITYISFTGQYQGRLSNAAKAACQNSIEDKFGRCDVEIAFAYSYDENVTRIEVMMK
ncbi:MAG: hypothetical protein ACI4EF_04200 [Coprococcus sp.]